MRQVTPLRLGLLSCLLSLLPLVAHAQDEEAFQVVRGNCTSDIQAGADDARTTRAPRRILRSYNNQWDASKTYPQLVILMEFSDTVFSNDRDYYDRLFNEPGFTDGKRANGSVADYFRAQSNGLFNPRFDIYGPVRINRAAKVGTDDDHGNELFYNATKQLLDSLSIDLSQYDWDGNGNVNQVIFVYAGLSGNIKGYEGFLWPSTGSFSTVKSNGYTINYFSSSSEKMTNKSYTGIGTICHEYSHCFGLPDIYPTDDNKGYSIVDEWDLMDGGNFTNRGWCPPSYTTLEKMLLGWYTPIELTEPTSVVDMKAISEGGDAYIIHHTNNEYLLLENRQFSGWDSYVPGNGLLIFHVDYNETDWHNNKVNNMKQQRRFSIVCADNMTYEGWEAAVPASDRYDDRNNHSIYMSTAPYPYVADGVTKDALTETTTPAAVMHNNNASGSRSLSKPITNIRMSEDGLISFDFMGGTETGIGSILASKQSAGYYNLQGQRTDAPGKGIYIKDGKKIIIK